jgi:hypothetical protein
MKNIIIFYNNNKIKKSWNFQVPMKRLTLSNLDAGSRQFLEITRFPILIVQTVCYTERFVTCDVLKINPALVLDKKILHLLSFSYISPSFSGSLYCRTPHHNQSTDLSLSSDTFQSPSPIFSFLNKKKLKFIFWCDIKKQIYIFFFI